MIDPEIEAAELGSQESPLSSQGYAEVAPDAIEKSHDDLERELGELPAELRTNLDRIALGLGAGALGRAQEVCGLLASDAEQAQQQAPEESRSPNTRIGRAETLSVPDIEIVVTALRNMGEQFAGQAKDQGDVKTFDLDKLSVSTESRGVAEFWYILTGSREFGTGQSVEFGNYVLESVQDQAAAGPGAESRKVVLRPKEPEVAAPDGQEAKPKAPVQEPVQPEAIARDSEDEVLKFEKRRPDDPVEQVLDRSGRKPEANERAA